MPKKKEEDKELNLPDVEASMPPPRVLSMDDYLEFVMFNLKYTVTSAVPSIPPDEAVTV